ncbi:MAG: DUF3617 domain-containing protein [Parasphingopyxis sp.]|uniref:DUF3617 domain-containing protein n=1 Tax=Parasphingopyxis sp. TaxID=1920299 RepID=UPI00262BEEE7|nr:DUF3617 domain-containing protein [uncultured Parasphingopyxis sp.]
MKVILIAGVAGLALAACSSGGGDNLQPGEWELTLDVTEANLPGAPEEMQQELIAELNRELAMDPVCISEEDSAEPTPELFIPNEAESECDFEGSTVENGEISISGTCDGEGGTLTIEGTYDATSMTATMEAELRDGNEVLQFTADMTGERSGDCTG